MATNPSSATMRLIEMAERLTPSGEIGDGMVAQFHEAATLARLEQVAATCTRGATKRRDGIERCLWCGQERVYSGNAFAAAWADHELLQSTAPNR